MLNLSTLTVSLGLLGLLGCNGNATAPGTAPPATPPPATATAAAEPAPLPERSVDEVERLLAAGSITVFDANGAETRHDQGVVPGARLLTSAARYDVAAELPAAKTTPLVFYCGNEHCTASDGAAHRAREAGYADVSVMRAGIAGWRAAGKPTQQI